VSNTAPSPELRDDLARIGALEDAAIDLGEAGLALAAMRRPGVSREWYREHLGRLAEDVQAHAAPRGGADASLSARAEALTHVIAGMHGYQGDLLTYDDLQNANLMRVIDRRKGLPIALALLYLHVARRLGWEANGINFPAHFLIRLEQGPQRLILDPFHSARILEPADLRKLLKQLAGEEAELAPEHYEPASNRQLLIRLQNNIKMRLLKAEEYDQALGIIETMRLIAPDLAELWYEKGAVLAQLGHLDESVLALETAIDRAETDATRHQAAWLLQQVRGRFN
jgi:regulator of sirC expression with transglutaminase-like and TPR domain